jgi:hypothetical protein
LKVKAEPPGFSLLVSMACGRSGIYAHICSVRARFR